MNGVMGGKKATGGAAIATCPHCGADVPDGAAACPGCGMAVAERGRARVGRIPKRRGALPMRVLANMVMRLAVACFSIAFFGYLIYTAYFWYDSWRTNRIYEDGTLRAPIVEEIDMTGGQKGHSLTFFGSDGDQLFIPELNRSYPFVGGLTQIDIADSSWFDLNPEGDEAAVITMTPVINTIKNGRVQLPEMKLTVDTPVSPLELIDPPSDRIEVDTSVFTMKLRVVPGSEVLINGEDQTDFVSSEGELTPNISVFAHGDNPVSISVSTPYHKQVRRDIVLYRAPQTIAMERSQNLDKSTNSQVFKVSGSAEPGARIAVDSAYVPDSLIVKESGSFEFRAKLTIIGDNVITWHASMDGRQDQYASYTVYYVPPLNEYSRKAWAMDYKGLMTTSDKWAADHRVFEVKGPVVDVFEENGEQRVIIDVAPEGAEARQRCVLTNKSSVKEPVVGQVYRAFADVEAGLVFYEDANCPRLICRYLLS